MKIRAPSTSLTDDRALFIGDSGSLVGGGTSCVVHDQYDTECTRDGILSDETVCAGKFLMTVFSPVWKTSQRTKECQWVCSVDGDEGGRAHVHVMYARHEKQVKVGANPCARKTCTRRENTRLNCVRV